MGRVLNMETCGMEKDREFVFTDKDFNWLRELAYQRMGITLSESKKELVYSRLSRRLRQVGLDSFKDYCILLQEGDEGEMINFTNAITTNLTAFFREMHHFDHMKKVVLPELLKKKPIPGGCVYGLPGVQRERSLIR